MTEIKTSLIKSNEANFCLNYTKATCVRIVDQLMDMWVIKKAKNKVLHCFPTNSACKLKKTLATLDLLLNLYIQNNKYLFLGNPKKLKLCT